MYPRITAVKHLQEYQLELKFTDGTVATLDFQKQIVGRGGVFLPLNDVRFFSQVAVDPVAKTIVWPNGVDFCPDVLYCEATGNPLPGWERDLKTV